MSGVGSHGEFVVVRLSSDTEHSMLRGTVCTGGGWSSVSEL